MWKLLGNWFSAAIGAGLFVSIINWFRENRREKRERHVSILREQIQNLYGPIYYLVTQNKTLFQAYATIHKAADEEYSGKRWAPFAQKSISKEIENTFEIANKYIEQVQNNNEKIMNILNTNIHYAEVEDYENFSPFIKDYFRLQIETGFLKMENKMDEKDNKQKLPMPVALKLPEISFLNQKFAEMIETRFIKIKNEYQKYYK
jgi:hypothetical protein